MTENDNKANELTGKEKRLANLKPLVEHDGMTEEELAYIRECRSKGGKARAEQLRKAKSLKELANQLLECKVSKERAKKVLGELADDIAEEDLTNGALLLGSMLNEVYENKTAKAAEFVRDTSGQRPKDQIELTAEVMTDNDRSLMADIAERLGIMPNKNSD